MGVIHLWNSSKWACWQSIAVKRLSYPPAFYIIRSNCVMFTHSYTLHKIFQNSWNIHFFNTFVVQPIFIESLKQNLCLNIFFFTKINDEFIEKSNFFVVQMLLLQLLNLCKYIYILLIIVCVFFFLILIESLSHKFLYKTIYFS